MTRGFRTKYADQFVDVIAQSSRGDRLGLVQIRYKDQSRQWVPLAALGELPIGLNILSELEVIDE